MDPQFLAEIEGVLVLFEELLTRRQVGPDDQGQIEAEILQIRQTLAANDKSGVAAGLDVLDERVRAAFSGNARQKS